MFILNLSLDSKFLVFIPLSTIIIYYWNLSQILNSITMLILAILIPILIFHSNYVVIYSNFILLIRLKILLNIFTKAHQSLFFIDLIDFYNCRFFYNKNNLITKILIIDYFLSLITRSHFLIILLMPLSHQFSSIFDECLYIILSLFFLPLKYITLIFF